MAEWQELCHETVADLYNKGNGLRTALDIQLVLDV